MHAPRAAHVLALQLTARRQQPSVAYRIRTQRQSSLTGCPAISQSCSLDWQKVRTARASQHASVPLQHAGTAGSVSLLRLRSTHVPLFLLRGEAC